jgi:putative transcriptional regulator
MHLFPSFFCLVLLLAASPAAIPAEDAANSIFLVARRGLPDPNFREAVVLVTKPQVGAPIGVIINRPLEQRLSEIFTEFETLKKRKDVLYFGGPVKPDGFVFLVRARERPARGMSVLKGIYFTGDIELIEKLLKRKNPTEGLRVFAGYSGWAPEQLQREIARGDWHILPASAETVFRTDPSKVWEELIKRAGVRKTHYTANSNRGAPIAPP